MLVAISLVALVGFAGVGIDVAKAYAARTRVKTVADAAAMAGAVEMLQTTDGAARRTAVPFAATTYFKGNPVEGAKNADSITVRPLVWDFTLKRGDAPKTGANDFSNPAVNAVEVKAWYDTPTTLAGVLGIFKLSLGERTVAALGGIGDAQDCLKPWAVGYQDIIDLLNTRFPVTPTRTLSSPLTPSDVAFLQKDTTQTISFVTSGDNVTTSGNIQKVVTYTSNWAPPTKTPGGPYQDAIQAATCTDRSIAPGDSLETTTGVGGGTTATALQTYCDEHGGTTSPKNNANTFACTGHPRIKLATWNRTNGINGNGLKVYVNAVGVFAITGFTKGAGKSGKEDQVTGFFVSEQAAGSYSGANCQFECKAALVF